MQYGGLFTTRRSTLRTGSNEPAPQGAVERQGPVRRRPKLEGGPPYVALARPACAPGRSPLQRVGRPAGLKPAGTDMARLGAPHRPPGLRRTSACPLPSPSPLEIAPWALRTQRSPMRRCRDSHPAAPACRSATLLQHTASTGLLQLPRPNLHGRHGDSCGSQLALDG